MLLLPLLSQEFTYRSRTEHNLLFICSHLKLSFSLSPFAPSIFNLSVYISTCQSADSWCYRPSSNPDSAGWCGCCKQTHSSLTDWSCFFLGVFLFLFFWRGNSFKVVGFFSHLTFRKVRNTARTLEPLNRQHLHVSCMSLLSLWLDHEGQLCMETWSWLVEFEST